MGAGSDTPPVGERGDEEEAAPGLLSSGDGNDCVEVAATPGTVHVRDSKDIDRPALRFAPHAWAGFLAYTATR
ncbi:DUF397 domain-containing protein [Streptomyces sp. NPDC004111]|uniref:DUF397 domain-containing protein n=1 Tax=Streptomyces sp. NPDC004111 TaxID=3364690 RepID=UPI00368ECE0A